MASFALENASLMRGFFMRVVLMCIETDDTWRGCWMLNEVRDGEFDEMPLSLDYLRRKYEG